MAARRRHAIVELTQGKVLASRHLDQEGGSALEMLGLGQIGHRLVERVDGHVGAQSFRQNGEGLRGVDVAVELVEDLLRLARRAADHWEHTGHDQDFVGLAAEPDDLRLDVAIEGPCFGEVVLRREHDVGDARRQRLARPRRAGLDQDRMTLRRARNVQAAFDGEVFSMERRHMQAARPHEETRLLVADKGVVGPAVPQDATGLDEFLGHGVALGVRRVTAAEHCGRLGIGRGDDVPGCAATGQMIERGEGTGDLIRLGVGGRAGGREPEPGGRHCQRREQRQRLELADGRGMLAIARGEAIAQEEHVELAAFGGRGDVLHQAEVRPALDDGVGMPPAADVMTRRLHEDAEAHPVLRCARHAQWAKLRMPPSTGITVPVI